MEEPVDGNHNQLQLANHAHNIKFVMLEVDAPHAHKVKLLSTNYPA